MEDGLINWKTTGHYRYLGPRSWLRFAPLASSHLTEREHWLDSAKRTQFHGTASGNGAGAFWSAVYGPAARRRNYGECEVQEPAEYNWAKPGSRALVRSDDPHAHPCRRRFRCPRTWLLALMPGR